MGGAYNTTGIDLPFSPFDDLKDFRYKGHFYGGGVSYGYQFVLGRHWNLGATIGLGYAYVRYKKYECEECGDMLEKSNKNYWGPTKVASESYLYILKITDYETYMLYTSYIIDTGYSGRCTDIIRWSGTSQQSVNPD